MKMRNLIFSVLFIIPFCAKAQEPVGKLMKTELERNFAILSKEEIPAYYIFLRMDESQVFGCSARFGKLQSTMQEPYVGRNLSSMVRVGSPALDNTHEVREAGSEGSFVSSSSIPINDNNPHVIKNAIWSQLDFLYKSGAKNLELIKANISAKVEQEDKSPDFTQEDAETHSEASMELNISVNDMQQWEQKIRTYSEVFSKNSDILDGSSAFYASLERQYIVDTEGRDIVQNRPSFHLILSANVLTEDGMMLPLYKSWYANSIEELPSDKDVIAKAEEMSATLSALKKAPVVESFSGPAILSPEAAGVFFHEIFGHRIEAARMKQEQDAQTFKKKIGERVLPKHFSITFDPTIKEYMGIPLSGGYLFDDEGIRGQRVEVVKNGTLSDFLMCRTPIEGFMKSNGHGRAQFGLRPVSRQSNMLVESKQKHTSEQLRKMLIKEAKAQKKEYAYYFKEVSGGFTTTGRYMPNSFNVTPLVVYRVYVDGRPDELVRGVDLVGTPLAMFSQIEACGTDYSVFNGTCGAESGGVPVSCVAPSVFVKRIETQKKEKGQSLPPVLPRPDIDNESSSQSDSEDNKNNDVIASSIEKEVERAMGLKIDGLQPPFFIAYTLGDFETLSINAKLGSIIASRNTPYRATTSRLLIGDYQCTDENYAGSVYGSSTYDGSPIIENNEGGIRYTVWRDLDALYKSAAETYEQKISAIKQLNIPAEELNIPDWDRSPVVQLNDLPDIEMDMDKAKYEEYIRAASAIFKEYKDIIDSDVYMYLGKTTTYFYNTEKTSYRLPRSFVLLGAVAAAMTEEGERVNDHIEYISLHTKDIPSLEQLQADCRALAEKVLARRNAPLIEESYTGPVLFEGLAVRETFYSNFMGGQNPLIARRRPLSSSGFAYGGNGLEEMIGKRITAKEITIEDLTGSKEYNGQPLYGYAPIDAEGVVPSEKLVLVENGILKTLLNNRVPTSKVPASSGHSLLGLTMGAQTTSGVIRMQDSRTKSTEALRKQLLETAKEEGYDYAYIVRKTMGGGSYPVDLYRVSVKDGAEQLIRSAVINNMSDQVFKDILAVSDKEVIHQTIMSGITTIIVPEAILFDDMSIQKDNVDNYQKPPIVSRPE